MAPKITTLFLDIGGVLLTNGWDRTARKRAADKFNLDLDEMNERHHLTFDTYEEGKLSLDTYLNRVVFHRDRFFSREDFRNFMFEQSKPYQEMIDLIYVIKKSYGLKVAAVSNEGKELAVYRIKKFKLDELMDFFVSSCFVHYRKPDEDIYRMALDMSQAVPEQVVYIDDRALFIEVAEGLGIRGIHHAGHQSTKRQLDIFGLSAE